MALIEELRKQGNFLFKYRSFFPLPLLIMGLTIHLFMQIQTKGESTTEYFYAICFGISLIGLIIRSLVIGYVPRKTSGRNTKQQVADVLNTNGMYSIVRHPLYVGNFFMWLGLATITANIWFVLFFVLSYWIYYERIMFAEEAFLREKFGDNYLNWANSVPSFIPSFSKWKTPSNSFSIKNVIRREYTGLFNLVLLVVIFRFIQSLVKTNYDLTIIGYNEKIWILIFLLNGFLFIFIRILRKRTKILRVEGR